MNDNNVKPPVSAQLKTQNYKYCLRQLKRNIFCIFFKQCFVMSSYELFLMFFISSTLNQTFEIQSIKNWLNFTLKQIKTTKTKKRLQNKLKNIYWVVSQSFSVSTKKHDPSKTLYLPCILSWNINVKSTNKPFNINDVQQTPINR